MPECSMKEPPNKIADPAGGARLQYQPVDHHIDSVRAALVQLGRIVQGVHPLVHPHPRVAPQPQPAQQVRVTALARPGHRCQHLEPGELGHRQDMIDDLPRGLPTDDLATGRAVRGAGARVQQPQVVVSSVIVPTVERGLWPVGFWSIDTAGDRPSTRSTSGSSTRPRNCRA
jgi:hypothetical protein